MKIFLVGMNHRSAPLAVREQFAIADVGPAVQKLANSQEITEAVIVSTCNRVDIVVATDQIAAARHRLEHFFVHELGGGVPLPDGRSLDSFTYALEEREAIAHILRVASSIDSMVVGEAQILGQVKDAYRLATEMGATGPILSRLFQRAFATAKRVKNETRVAQRPTSVARVAVELAKQIFENLGDKTALLIGAGEMIELALFALRREGLGHQLVANRTRERAADLAARFDASAHGLDELSTLLSRADLILTCIGGDRPLLTRDLVQSALDARRHRPIFLIDLGVPRNVAQEVNELDSCFVYDIDDLQEVAEANVARRRRESESGEEIVEEEQLRFEGWLAALRAVPTIRHLRARAEQIQMLEIERHLGRLDLDEEQRQAVELLTRSVVNKILHAPLSRLRAETDREGGFAMLEAARALFALDDPTAPGADPELDFATTRVSEEDLEYVDAALGDPDRRASRSDSTDEGDGSGDGDDSCDSDDSTEAVE